MPVRRSKNKTVSRKTQIVVIFWIIFVIVIVCVFIANAPTIFKNLEIFTNSSKTTDETAVEEQLPEVHIENDQPPVSLPVLTPPSLVTPPLETQPAQQEETKPPQQTQTQQQTQPPQTQTQSPPQSPPAEMRSRAVYFAQVNRDGQILQSRVTRRIAASNTPLRDTITAMLIGPSPGELSGNLLSFIPQNTRLLSVAIHGTTAYVNFSEEFMFNKYGVEGYRAQLRQVIWTVTEFDNVKNVQILINGEVKNYLGDDTGIVIGAPVDRNSNIF